jgi:DNA-binding LacI/PurR family transcriptional regulator
MDEEDLKSSKGEPHGALMLSRILVASPKCDLTFIKSESLSGKIKTLATYDAIVWVQPSNASMSSISQFEHKALVVNRYPEGMSFVSTNHRIAVKELSLYTFEKSGDDCQAFYIEHERDGKSFVQDERREGFIEACATLGIFYRICELPANHEGAIQALARLTLDTKRKVVIVSGTCIFSGAVLLTAEKHGFTLNKNFFYADFDNEHSLARTGRQMTTVIQDYSGMGTAVVKALDLIATGERATIYVPHHIEKGF